MVCILERLAKAVKRKRIRINISCGRSTDYVDEYYIEDTEDNVIHPCDFPAEWKGKLFELVEEEEEQMFIIAPEDVSKVKAVVCNAVSMLNDGAKRVDLDVELGDEIKPLTVTGYWVVDVMRIDIKIKES